MINCIIRRRTNDSGHVSLITLKNHIMIRYASKQNRNSEMLLNLNNLIQRCCQGPTNLVVIPSTIIVNQIINHLIFIFTHNNCSSWDLG